MRDKPRYQLTIEAMPGEDGTAAPVLRLRAWLKRGLRLYGLRCTAAHEIDAMGNPVGLPTAEQPTEEVETGADTTRKG